jgi:hypothetical protein
MQEHEILKHIRKYHSSGIIHDALIPLFDQDGRWRGDQIRWQTDASPPLLEGMRKAFLRSSRRTRKCRSGTVLRTSFYWQGAETVRTTYCGIDGSFVVDSDAMICAANLRQIGGHFISKTAERIDVPNLKTVGGSVGLICCFLLKAPRLRDVGGNVTIAGQIPPKLETVGGRMGVYWSFDCHAPRLQHVGGCLVPHKSTKLVVPMLETVGGSLVMTHAATRIEAPRLCSVGGDFLAGSVAYIRAPRLRSVTGDMDTRSTPQYYHPAIKVGGQWTICPGAVEDWVMRAKARELMRAKGGQLYL